MNVITHRLRTVRELRQLTQATLAERADISASYLSELEKSNDVPSPEVQTRLARVLGVSTEELWPAA